MLVTRHFLLFCMPLLALAGCAEAPKAFRADSAANQAAQPAARLPVANVLMAQDPLMARVCPDNAPCLLPASATAPAASSGHEHHHHH